MFAAQLAVFLYLLRAIHGVPPCIVESKTLINERITGGTSATRGEFPHQVSLQSGYPPVIPVAHFCGGSIIADKWILTAAHCVRAVPDYAHIIVKAGKQLIKSHEHGEQIAIVDKSFVHEKYGGNVGPYDIALLRLRKPFKLNKFVASIGLPRSEIVPGKEVVLSGWGSVSTNDVDVMPDNLQKVTLPIIDLDTCKESFEKLLKSAPLHDTNICTGSAGGLSACSGDSGGPLIRKNVDGGAEIVGIVSWGITPCGSMSAPSVFVRVSSFMSWIDHITTTYAQ